MGSTKFVIPVQPKPKQRPQHGKGYTFTPKETREYETIVSLYARRAFKRPATGAVSIKIDFYMPIPKSWPAAKKRAAEAGRIRPTGKPDIDNLTKAILDGMNDGIAYTDDSQIVELVAGEWYGDPKTEIELIEL